MNSSSLNIILFKIKLIEKPHKLLLPDLWFLSCNKQSFTFSEAAARGILWKWVFLKFLENSQENTCARDLFFIEKLQSSGQQLY